MDKRIQDAQKFLRFVNDADSYNRQDALDDLQVLGRRSMASRGAELQKP
jgi:hypothetical protein